jgi:hypothetical protein
MTSNHEASSSQQVDALLGHDLEQLSLSHTETKTHASHENTLDSSMVSEEAHSNNLATASEKFRQACAAGDLEILISDPAFDLLTDDNLMQFSALLIILPSSGPLKTGLSRSSGLSFLIQQRIRRLRTTFQLEWLLKMDICKLLSSCSLILEWSFG